MRTRFAPSPTGPLHLGHAYSAILAHDMARANRGEFLLRIEDIDTTRSRPEWENLIYEDLNWLGLSWDGPVLRQSERQQAYRDTLQWLWDLNLVFACTCSRRDVIEAATAPNEGTPPQGPDGVIYPGTCRARTSDGGKIPMPEDAALRLSMSQTGVALRDHGILDFEELDTLGNLPTRIRFTTDEVSREIGDVVLARRDMGTSYHLSVVLDDAHQGITHVIRGEDLFEATRIHVLLQHLLGLKTPVYHHHRLIRDDQGKRLAKRDDARAIRTYREDGASPDDIRRMVGL